MKCLRCSFPVDLDAGRLTALDLRTEDAYQLESGILCEDCSKELLLWLRSDLRSNWYVGWFFRIKHFLTAQRGVIK